MSAFAALVIKDLDLVGNVPRIISGPPPVIGCRANMKFEKLLEQVPALKNAMKKDDKEKG